MLVRRLPGGKGGAADLRASDARRFQRSSDELDADDERGEVVHAVVDVDTAEVTEDVLRAWTRDRLDPEKRPRSWQLVHEPLRADTGKVRRSEWRTDSTSTKGTP